MFKCLTLKSDSNHIYAEVNLIGFSGTDCVFEYIPIFRCRVTAPYYYKSNPESAELQWSPQVTVFMVEVQT